MKYIDWLTKWLENYVRPSIKVRTYERYMLIIEKHIKLSSNGLVVLPLARVAGIYNGKFHASFSLVAKSRRLPARLSYVMLWGTDSPQHRQCSDDAGACGAAQNALQIGHKAVIADGADDAVRALRGVQPACDDLPRKDAAFAPCIDDGLLHKNTPDTFDEVSVAQTKTKCYGRRPVAFLPEYGQNPSGRRPFPDLTLHRQNSRKECCRQRIGDRREHLKSFAADKNHYVKRRKS